MKVLVTGSSGLIGSALVDRLARGGHVVTRLVRREPPAGSDAVRWDPEAGTIDADRLEGHDAAVHLAGEGIAAAPWTDVQKARIRDSRVKGTRLLCGILPRLDAPPKVLVSASAIGYYGDRGHEVLREESPPGTGFLPDVCREWEAATDLAAGKGIRVVRLRIGMVLGPGGGALARMLPVFRAGLGGRVGNGRQYVSWIALDDLVEIAAHALGDASLEGPVNAVAPRPVINREFTRVLARVLGRPAILAVPAFAVRLTMGEMADELLLSSAHVEPTKLLASGFHFRFPELEGAIRHVLGR